MLFDGVQEFVRVVQAGSFSQAARNLGVTPSAVSKAVSRLEATLGTRLLNRTSRSVTLTPDGESFLATAEPAVMGVEEARARFHEQDATVDGVFRLSIPSAFGPLFLKDVVTSLMVDHPDLRLEVSATDRFVDFAQERIDLALRLGDLADSQLVAKRVLSMPFATVAAPGYLAKHGTPASVANLQDHAHLGFLNRNRGRVRHWTFSSANGPVSISPADGTIVDDPLTFRELLLAGVGIGQAPSYLVGRDIASGHLVRVLPEETTGEIALSFVYPRPLGRSKRLRAVISVFETAILSSGQNTPPSRS